MKNIKLKIGFIGAGSIGSLFGGYLATMKSDNYILDINLFCRRENAEAINKNGLIIDIIDEIKEIKNIRAYVSADNFIKISKSSFDFLFLTTKCYDIVGALTQYKELINECKWFVVLQNGIGNEDIIKHYCPPEKIIRAVTSNGVTFKFPGRIIHSGKGITKIGFPFIRNLDLENMKLNYAYRYLNYLSEILNLSGLQTIIVEDIVKECWEKVFVNIGINAFGALTRLKNGQLLRNEGLKVLMGEAVKEAIKVAEFKNVNLSKKNYIAIMYDVAEKTSENKNSMLQDILKGGNTEIDYMNGKIVKYAQKLGLKVPINETLTYLVKGLEFSRN
jgi:2-dehydropantoate 2-reductase